MSSKSVFLASRWCTYVSLWSVVSLLTGCDPQPQAESTDQHQQPFYFNQTFPFDNASVSGKTIAIIGGGTAGMYTAWLLRGMGHKVTIYEKKGRLGGNVFTAYLGSGLTPGTNFTQTDKNGATVHRWADLGTNDFNTKTYRNFSYMLDWLRVGHKPLQNTTYYGTVHSSSPALWSRTDLGPYFLCSEGLWQNTTDCQAIQFGLNGTLGSTQFFQNGVSAVLNQSMSSLSVDQYMTQLGYSQPFIDHNLKPRINGMYFTNEADPGTMPMRFIMSYYILQEGLTGGAVDPDRRHFAKGASEWIRALYAQNTTATGSMNPSYPSHFAAPAGPVNFQLCANVQSINVQNATKTVTWTGSPTTEEGCGSVRTGATDTYDYVFMAANSAGVQSIFANANTVGIEPTLKSKFAAITPTYSRSHVHTWKDEIVGSTWSATQKAEARLAHSTYNIYEFPSIATQPFRWYSITYVENKHQNDALNPIFANVSTTPFYTTVGGQNATSDIPRAFPAGNTDPQCNATYGCELTMQFNSGEYPPGSELPGASYLNKNWWNGKQTDQVELNHTRINNNYVSAQVALQGEVTPAYTVTQGAQGYNGLYMVGGISLGAQLQEEILVQAREAATQFEDDVWASTAPGHPKTYQNQQRWNFSPYGIYQPNYLATILNPTGYFAGQYFDSGQGFGTSHPCMGLYQLNYQKGVPFKVTSCNSESYGDTYLTVQNAASANCTCVDDDSSCTAYTGRASCDCNPTDDGVATLCASVFSDSLPPTWWKYDVLYKGSGSIQQPNCGEKFFFNVNAGQQVSVSTCDSYTGDPWVSLSGACTCTNNDTPGCGANGKGASCTCQAAQSGPVTVCAASNDGLPASWSYQVKIVDPNNYLSYNPALYSLNGKAYPGGNQNLSFNLPTAGITGVACSADVDSLSCPPNAVAVGVNYEQGPINIARPKLICAPVQSATSVSASTTTTTALCGPTSTNTNLSCPSGRVMVGERLWTSNSVGNVTGIGIYCQDLVTGTITSYDPSIPTPSSLNKDALCPEQTQIVSISNVQLQSTLPDILYKMNLNCRQTVPVELFNSCAERCGQSASGIQTCSCESTCTPGVSGPTGCCLDYTDICVSTASCAGRCGATTGTCTCDANCALNNTCCDDMPLVCSQFYASWSFPQHNGALPAGNLLDVGATQGEIWAVASDSTIYQYTAADTWTSQGAGMYFRRVSVNSPGMGGRAWAIRDTYDVYQRKADGSGWDYRSGTQFAGQAEDIGAGGGAVYVVDTSRRIFQYTATATWRQLAGYAYAIDADDGGLPWIIGNFDGSTTKNIYRFVPSSCAGGDWTSASCWVLVIGALPNGGNAVDIGVSGSQPNVDLTVAASNTYLYQWRPYQSTSTWNAWGTAATPLRIASDVSGNFWYALSNGWIKNGREY